MGLAALHLTLACRGYDPTTSIRFRELIDMAEHTIRRGTFFFKVTVSCPTGASNTMSTQWFYPACTSSWAMGPHRSDSTEWRVIRIGENALVLVCVLTRSSLDLSRSWAVRLRLRLLADLQRLAMAGCPTVAPSGRGSSGPGLVLPGRRGGLVLVSRGREPAGR